MRYIETIKIENGKIQNLEYHMARVARTIGHELDICAIIPWQHSLGTVKYRLIYDSSGILEISYSPYITPPIKTLKVIECSDINYEFKLEDRTAIDSLMAQKGFCDDIIITRDSNVTDSSFSNILFKNSEGLFTSDTPLLRGTKREQMIDRELIKVIPITTNDIKRYDQIILVNAMTTIEIEITNVCM